MDKFRFMSEIDKNWFMNREVDEWNKLNVDASAIESFKWSLDRLVNGNENY